MTALHSAAVSTGPIFPCWVNMCTAIHYLIQTTQSSINMDFESFALKKNDYGQSTESIFKSLWADEDFKDVTLASNDHKLIWGHKAILGAASSFFKNIFKNNSAANLVLYLKGVSSKDLESILEFIYCGETNINKVDLDSFLDVAKELKIEGLMEPRTLQEDLISDVISDDNLATATATDTEDDANESEVFVKIENMNDSNSSECSKFSENENPDFSSTLNSLNSSLPGKRKGKHSQSHSVGDSTGDGTECAAEEKKYSCEHCAFCSAHKGSVIRHNLIVHGIDIKHTKEGKYSCDSCDFKTNHVHSLKRHSELKAHNLIVHGIDTIKHTKEGKYSCDSCDFKTNHVSSLKRHSETLHTERK